MQTINPSFSNNNIPIVFSCDNNYAPYLAVAIQSVIENASSNNNYDIFVLDEDFSQDTKNKILLQIKNKPNVNITFVAIKHYLQNLDKNIFYISGNISLATYYRFFIPRIFSNFSKVIYLDCDLVLITDIAELYNTNIQNHILGVVRDIMMERLCLEKKKFINYLTNNIKVKPYDYFNAGVLLFNIAKANANNFEEACINKLIELKNPIVYDQDVLNALYSATAYSLNTKWNVDINTICSTNNLQKALPINLYNTYMQAYNTPSIVHYAGSNLKPWHKPYLPLAHYFWQYAKNTSYNSYYKSLLKNNNTKLKVKLIKYKIISLILFGKSKQKYKNKYNTLKTYFTL